MSAIPLYILAGAVGFAVLAVAVSLLLGLVIAVTETIRRFRPAPDPDNSLDSVWESARAVLNDHPDAGYEMPLTEVERWEQIRQAYAAGEYQRGEAT